MSFGDFILAIDSIDPLGPCSATGCGHGLKSHDFELSQSEAGKCLIEGCGCDAFIPTTISSEEMADESR